MFTTNTSVTEVEPLTSTQIEETICIIVSDNSAWKICPRAIFVEKELSSYPLMKVYSEA